MYINKSRSYLGRTYDFKVFIICNEKVQRETYIEWIEMSSRPLLCGVVIEFRCAGVGLDSFNLFSSPFRRGG